MNQSILQEYFSNPYDTNNVNVKYVNLWCNGIIQSFVEQHMDDTNYKFFGKMFQNNECPIVRFTNDAWMTDDLWVYNSIIIDYRKLAEMSNRNVAVMAKFMRMNYFLKFMEYNKNKITNPYIIFCDIFDILSPIIPKTKKLSI